MRLPRIDFPGARHHVMNRGARRAPIFFDDQGRELFLSILEDFPKRFGVRVHGYALMPNHYHLMLESVTGRLPRAMRHLGGEFTRRLNQQHSWDGPLFRGRYHNRLVSTDAYWRHLLGYLHVNPAAAAIEDRFVATSHEAYLGKVPRPEWLVTDELQTLFGSEEAYATYVEALSNGQLTAPDEFDPERLWAPNSTGTVDVPDLSAPLMDLSEALSQVCQVTGLDLAEVVATPRGRRPNRANWLAAWWLSRGCGVDHGKIALALGTSHSGVSKRVRRAEEGFGSDEQLAGWATALRAR